MFSTKPSMSRGYKMDEEKDTHNLLANQFNSIGAPMCGPSYKTEASAQPTKASQVVESMIQQVSSASISASIAWSKENRRGRPPILQS